MRAEGARDQCDDTRFAGWLCSQALGELMCDKESLRASRQRCCFLTFRRDDPFQYTSSAKESEARMHTHSLTSCAPHPGAVRNWPCAVFTCESQHGHPCPDPLPAIVLTCHCVLSIVSRSIIDSQKASSAVAAVPSSRVELVSAPRCCMYMYVVAGNV